ncbi:MAG TPA: glycosyltransferase family 39 protein [Verrucomicrobiae bacterium]|nr:glycosyltransferase family 39 protein [Verrucomicrobiae bacterium]
MKSPQADELATEQGVAVQLRESSSVGRAFAFCRAHALLVVFLAGFVVRVIFILAYGPTAPPWHRGDDQAYDTIAYRLVTEHVFANSFYPPGYPLFLALNYAVFGRSWFLARLVQALIGAGTCALTYRLAGKVFSEREGLLAGFLLAVYPGHVFYCWRLMAEPLYIFLLVSSLLLALTVAEHPRPLWAFALGALIGVSQLVKGNMVFFLPMSVVWLGFSVGSGVKRRAVNVAAMMAGMILAALIQPTANFLSPAHQAHLLPGNAGGSLWVGNNPQATGSFYIDDNNPAVREFIERHGFTESLKNADYLHQEAIYRSLGLSWICENPGQFLALLPKKLNNAFGLFPKAQVLEGNSRAQIVHLLTYGLMAPFALVGMIVGMRRWRTTSLLYIVVASYMLTVLVFFGTPRYTLLIIPELLVFASCGMLTAYTCIIRSRQASASMPIS